MKTLTKISIGLIGLILGGLLFYYIGWSFSPGSYSKAEIYKLEISEDSLIQIIKEVKLENPNLELKQMVRIPNGQDFQLTEGRQDSSDYWYDIYFYYPDKQQIVKTWIRPNFESGVDFAFVALNNGLTLGNWVDVNQYFWWWKNKPIKTEFENRILEKIKQKIKKKE